MTARHSVDLRPPVTLQNGSLTAVVAIVDLALYLATVRSSHYLLHLSLLKPLFSLNPITSVRQVFRTLAVPFH